MKMKPENDKYREKITKKQFKKIIHQMEKIGIDLGKLLPAFQKLPIFNKTQVSELSAFIDKYDKFKSEVYTTFENKTNPEDWNEK